MWSSNKTIKASCGTTMYLLEQVVFNLYKLFKNFPLLEKFKVSFRFDFFWFISTSIESNFFLFPAPVRPGTNEPLPSRTGKVFLCSFLFEKRERYKLAKEFYPFGSLKKLVSWHNTQDIRIANQIAKHSEILFLTAKNSFFSKD